MQKQTGMDGKADGSNCITPEEYEKALAGIQGPRHILTVLDACFSGLFKPGSSRGIGVLNKRSRYVLASVEDYFTPDVSIFFPPFLKRLQEGHPNPGAILTGQYIADDVRDKMENTKGNLNKSTYFSLLGTPGGDFYFPKKKR